MNTKLKKLQNKVNTNIESRFVGIRPITLTSIDQVLTKDFLQALFGFSCDMNYNMLPKWYYHYKKMKRLKSKVAKFNYIWGACKFKEAIKINKRYKTLYVPESFT